MNRFFKKLLPSFARPSPQPEATLKKAKAKPKYALEADHLNAAAIVSEEIGNDEYRAAQEYFNRNKAS